MKEYLIIKVNLLKEKSPQTHKHQIRSNTYVKLKMKLLELQ
jgi:hypothetical protein